MEEKYIPNDFLKISLCYSWRLWWVLDPIISFAWSLPSPRFLEWWREWYYKKDRYFCKSPEDERNYWKKSLIKNRHHDIQCRRPKMQPWFWIHIFLIWCHRKCSQTTRLMARMTWPTLVQLHNMNAPNAVGLIVDICLYVIYYRQRISTCRQLKMKQRFWLLKSCYMYLFFFVLCFDHIILLN